MNRNRILTGIAIALLVGFIASHYVYKRLQLASAVKPLDVDEVVVASVPLPLGTRLEAPQIRLIPWPVGNRPVGTFDKIQDCIGRAVITPLAPNEPILEAKLAPREAGAGLPAAIPEGSRAVSVRVDDVVGVAGFAMPGTMVDVLVTGDLENSGNSVTRTILEDVRVLAAGQQVQQDKEGKPQTVSVVTLLVNPEQANKLTLASTEGRIHLSLRNTIDSSQVDPPPVYKTTLFGGAPVARIVSRRVKADPPSKPPSYVVEIIRGDKRETQSFPVQ